MVFSLNKLDTAPEGVSVESKKDERIRLLNNASQRALKVDVSSQ